MSGCGIKTVRRIILPHANITNIKRSRSPKEIEEPAPLCFVAKHAINDSVKFMLSFLRPRSIPS